MRLTIETFIFESRCLKQICCTIADCGRGYSASSIYFTVSEFSAKTPSALLKKQGKTNTDVSIAILSVTNLH